MINERPLLTVRRTFPRPDSRSVSRFSGAATVHLADAMDGRGAESSYPKGPGGQVHVPERIRDLLASEQVRYLS